jgi:hypothetical protein
LVLINALATVGAGVPIATTVPLESVTAKEPVQPLLKLASFSEIKSSRHDFLRPSRQIEATRRLC